MSLQQHQAIVLDTGSCWVKAGFAGQESPESLFASVTYRHMNDRNNHRASIADMGNMTRSMEQKFIKKRVLKHGLIDDWERMELIWQHTMYNEIRTPPTNHTLLMAIRPDTLEKDRTRITEIMLEEHEFLGVNLSPSNFLGLLLHTNYNSVVVDIGYEHTQAMYANNFEPNFSTIQTLNIGGHDIDHYLKSLLYSTNLHIFDLYTHMKEQYCSVGNSSKSKDFELPDGNILHMTDEQQRCGELLFEPSVYEQQNIKIGIQGIVYDAIASIDSKYRRNVDVFVIGSTSLLPGLGERLQKELSSYGLGNKVVTHPYKYATWEGGSCLASLSTFDQWTTREQYYEYGASLLPHRVKKTEYIPTIINNYHDVMVKGDQ